MFIVSEEWFFKSIEQEMVLDVKQYLLKAPFMAKRLLKKLQGQKPGRVETDAAKDSKSQPKTHARILEKKHELHAMIDDDCPYKSKKPAPHLTILMAHKFVEKDDIVVWLDDNNVAWDAILIKDLSAPVTTSRSYRSYPTAAAITYNSRLLRLQLLYDLKKKAYLFWNKDSSALIPTNEIESFRGNEAFGDRNFRIVFKNYFFEKTGLSWESRWDTPQKDKFVFVPRIFEDVEVEEAASSALNGDHRRVKLPQAVYDVLGTIFTNSQKAHAEAVIKKVACGRFDDKEWHFRLTLRAARSLIHRIKEIVFDRFHRRDESRKELLKTLGKIYLALMWNANLNDPPEWKLPASSEVQTWVKEEIAALKLLNNLAYATDMIESPESIPRNQMLNKVYLALGLADMTPGS